MRYAARTIIEVLKLKLTKSRFPLPRFADDHERRRRRPLLLFQ